MFEVVGDDFQFCFGLVVDQVDIVFCLVQVGFQGWLLGGVVDEQEVVVDCVFYLCQGQFWMVLFGMLVGGFVWQIDQVVVVVVGLVMVGIGEMLVVVLVFGVDFGFMVCVGVQVDCWFVIGVMLDDQVVFVDVVGDEVVGFVQFVEVGGIQLVVVEYFVQFVLVQFCGNIGLVFDLEVICVVGFDIFIYCLIFV